MASVFAPRESSTRLVGSSGVFVAPMRRSFIYREPMKNRLPEK
ncbi:MAG TPA: hypothetical protein VM821_08035 [Abditibacteriaceae bacterium]|nr:hypothetical protein [Abditibacteriaceae bacterium]